MLIEGTATPQPLDGLMIQHGLTNADLVNASTEQLSFKMVQKGRKGRRLTPNIQDKILRALLKLKPELKLARRHLFIYEPEGDFIEQVREALSLLATQKIEYPEFIDLLSKAGVTRYSVDVRTGRATFFGIRGEAHIEDAPAKSLPEGVSEYEANIRSMTVSYKGTATAYKEKIPVFGAEPTPKVIVPKKPKPKAEKKPSNVKRIKKTGKFIVKHRVKRRQFKRRK